MKKLGAKIFILISIITLVSMSIMFLANIIIFNSLFNQLRTDAYKVVSESVNSIDGDQLEKVIENKSMDSEEYKEVQQSMTEFKNDQDIKYFYTMTKDEKNAYILVDSSLINTSPIGEEYDLEKGIVEAFSGKISANEDPVEDDYGSFISAYAPIKNSSGEIIAIAGVDKDVTHFLFIRNKLFISTGVIASILFLLSIIASLIFSKKISKNVKRLNRDLNIMSQGDLTVPIHIKSNDEIQVIAESINGVRLGTVNILLELKQSVNRVTQQINSLNSLSHNMAQSSEEVAVTVQEVTGEINTQSEEMNSINGIVNNFGDIISQTVGTISLMNTSVETISKNAQLSNQDLTLLEEAIKSINVLFSNVKREIESLEEYLSKIGEVTELINNIADQTNLLALNAAIEAARAGESGKGFAVVADEIRKLAEQSKVSASDISQLLNNVNEKNNSVILTSNAMDSKLNEQNLIISNSIGSYKEIVNNVENIIPQINELSNFISRINREKEKIIQSIDTTTSAVEEVSASSEQIAASSEELSSSSQEIEMSAQFLQDISKNMVDVIEHFKLPSENQ